MFNNLINILNTRKFAFVCLIGFAIPFFVFSFWNHLSADDYFIGIKKQTEKFWPVQYYYYTHWHGRYISIFSTSLLVFSNLLYSKTYLIGVYFLAATLLSFLYLTFQINKYVLKNMFGFFSLVVISLLLLVAELNIIPQPLTAFYWYSGAITYQQPLIFLLLLSGSATGIFYSGKRKKLYVAATLILLVCMQGYNEMITIWFLINTTVSAVYYMYKKRKNKQIITLMICNYITAVILLFAPGNFHRAAAFDHSSVFTILAISCGRFILLNWYFLKEPLWWFLLVLIASKEVIKKQLLRNSFFVLLKEVRLIHLLLLYTFFGVLTYFPILYVSNGSIPNRMENQICFLSGFTLMFIICLKLPEKSSLPFSSLVNNYRFLLISIFIFCTSNMERIFETICSGYFYNQVMEERLSKLKSAHSMQLSEVNLDDYSVAVQKKINAQFPNGSRKTLMELMEQKPPLLFFTDDLNSSANVAILQRFYNVDTIIINRK